MNEDGSFDGRQVGDVPAQYFCTYGAEELEQEVRDAVKVTELVGEFRTRGHLCAQLDPLKRVKRGPWFSDLAQTRPRSCTSASQSISSVLTSLHVHLMDYLILVRVHLVLIDATWFSWLQTV